ncbi:ferredoxin family protein [Rhizobium sp. NLR17b]|uniref:ferredoxin FdxA n=1 Tax=Rhizobium sp. NLR17b TaxID=2731114 RepID=UPI001C828409|nr:ferredoxin FdxA [Rhizobium sp. NLR17b]MBX5272662.1 ferredoxin family protein [Rhizobium sp. NLR17b]
MTFVVTENCIACKYMDCVEVCPVECFYEGENMLVIHPDQCIDCGICEPECPASAIRPDTEVGLHVWADLNRHYSSLWPRIHQKRRPLANADTMNGAAAKISMFSKNPGEGG